MSKSSDIGNIVTKPCSVSEGTLRSKDLIQAFLDKLCDLQDPHYVGLVREYRDAKREDDQDALDWFLDEVLFGRLQMHAGRGLRFGTSEGDGASFGFWKEVD